MSAASKNRRRKKREAAQHYTFRYAGEHAGEPYIDIEFPGAKKIACGVTHSPDDLWRVVVLMTLKDGTVKPAFLSNGFPSRDEARAMLPEMRKWMVDAGTPVKDVKYTVSRDELLAGKRRHD